MVNHSPVFWSTIVGFLGLVGMESIFSQHGFTPVISLP